MPVSGTAGSGVALLIAAGVWALWRQMQTGRWALETVLAIGTIVACVLSVRWGSWAVARYGGKDPKQFTLDEFAGQWVALLGLPLLSTEPSWLLAAVALGQFVLFRGFDVWKPPPARQVERWPDGWGILCDDLFAGLYANVLGQVLWRLTPLAAWLGEWLASRGA